MMSRKWVFLAFLGLCALSLTASASVTDPNIISAVVRLNPDGDSGDTTPTLVPGGLLLGAAPFIDRTFTFGSVNRLGGIDYIRTCVDDKDNPNYQLNVTVNKAGTLYLIIDNRVGSGTLNDTTTPPDLGGGVMDWVLTMGFTQTAYTLDMSTPSTVYELPVTAGTYSLGAQNDGGSRLMYLVAAVPAGWNFVPEITGVPASQLLVDPVNSFDVNATSVDHDGVPGTGLTAHWTTIAQPEGSTVTYAPDADTEDVTITVSALGSYTVQLSVSDGEQTAVRTVQMTYRLPQFAVQATDFCEIANDSNLGPTGTRRSNPMYVKNYDSGTAQRRRIGYQRYDISSLKQEGKVFANTYLTYYASKKDSVPNVYVYPIREELDGFTLNGTRWTTAPGVMNNPVPPLNSLITAATLDWADIYPLTLTFPVPALSTWYNSVTSTKLDEVLNSDTDGSIVLMFVAQDPVHNACELQVYTGSTIEPETNLKGIILRGNMMTAEWAWNPEPANFSITAASLTELTWSNPPQPVGDITCDVYFGSSEPNAALPHYGLPQIASGISGTSVAVPYALTQYEDYYWIVDVHDSGKTPDLAAGNLWTFNTSNAPPTVAAGDDQYLWLNNAGDENTSTVNLDGLVTDDGLPSGQLTRLWTQTDGETVIDANSIIIATGQLANTDDITLVLPQTDTYTFVLTGNDGSVQISDSVTVRVAATPCAAAHLKTPYTALAGDLNDDCYVDIADLKLFVDSWLECSSLAPCY